MKRIIFAAVITIAVAGDALAADLSQPLPPPASAAYTPAVIPVYNWGGAYVGINGGWGFGTARLSAPPASSDSISTSGGIVGGTLGANWQTVAFVFGLEGDINYSGISTGTASSICTVGANCQVGSTWLSTVRARVGYADDRLLFYATGGGAFGNVRISANAVTDTTTHAGWTAGLGVEFAFAHDWTGRVEYLFVNLNNAPCSSACGGVPVAVSMTENLVRAGVDFKFGP